jgi:predicted aldo/keto reductase-like oxidoreductase
MKYRTLAGTRVSALGFGAMRLPTKGKESDVDQPQTTEMIRYAIDHGVNYVDTAYVYHGGNIPVNFELFNNATVFKGNSITLCRNLYGFLPETEKASACQQCGVCEEKCPQGIEIAKMMGEVQEQFK